MANISWEDYVDRYADLSSAWSKIESGSGDQYDYWNPLGATSKAEFGRLHWGESGSSENAINNYISNAYNNWSNPPEIVGLVGDVGGSYNIDCDSYGWGGYSGSSDVIYSYVEGNDLLPEVMIGRISANGTSDLYNIINKKMNW